MSSPAMNEAAPRNSIETVIGERSPSPKIESPVGQQARPEPVTPPHSETLGLFEPPPVEPFRPLRAENLTHDQRIEWEHIRAQLGMQSDIEEGRGDWENIREELGFADDDKNLASLFKQIGQAWLVFLTTPFMLLHGVFKMSGAFLRSLGLVFSALGGLCKKLTYKPKKYRKNKNREPGK
jgi:hypothetical protein